jgi:parallel beta-helix repeat protein
VFNALYELDTPGEWYLNRDTGDLYFWPPVEDIENYTVQVSSLFSLITFTDTSWVTFEGIEFSGTRGHVIRVAGGNNITFKKCKINNGGSRGIEVGSGSNHSIVGCDIANIGTVGISVNGGDRSTLTPSNHTILNNHVYNFGRLERTNGAGISLNGVGATAAYNTLHNSPHTALYVSGNNHTIQHNEIFDVGYETEDAGAIYSGRDWTARGNVIEHNYLHHIIGFNGKINTGIYLDDQASGFTITNNLFYKTTFGVYVGGGDDNIIRNNTFISARYGVHIDDRGLTWQTEATSAGQQLLERLQAVPYSSSVWASAYPSLSQSLDEPFAPFGNIIENNQSNTRIDIRAQGTSLAQTSVGNNLGNSALHVNLSNGNISSLSVDTIDLSNIGVFLSEDRVTWPIGKPRRNSETNAVIE